MPIASLRELKKETCSVTESQMLGGGDEKPAVHTHLGRGNGFDEQEYVYP